MRSKLPLAKQQAVGKPQADMSPLVDEFVENLNGWKKEVAGKLRNLIRAASRELREEVKWGMPCYTADGKNVCSIGVMKDTVNFVLFQGANLSDPDGLIEGTGKSMRHVKLRTAKDVDKSKFQKFIQESLRLLKE